MKKRPYALAIDGSTDTGVEKMNPLTVRIFDPELGSVTTHFLDMCMSSSSTAEGIFSKMQKALSKHNILWDNCVHGNKLGQYLCEHGVQQLNQDKG